MEREIDFTPLPAGALHFALDPQVIEPTLHV